MNKLIHRDIKPENYLKVQNRFKLIDFGLVRIKTGPELTKNVGTGLFQAPEMINDERSYNEKVDIWALACVFYEIFSHSSLF